MKNLRWMMAMTVAGMFLFSACSSDDDNSSEEPKEDVFSELTPEEHKVKLEDEGIKFVDNMSAAANLKAFDVIDTFFGLTNPFEGDDNAIAMVLHEVESLKNGPKSIDLKTLVEEEPNFSLSGAFAEQAGIYTWDAALNDWTKEAADDQITIKFTTEGEKAAIISLSNFDYQLTTNPDLQGMELPKSVELSLTLEGTQLIGFSFEGQYYDNDTPKFLQEIFTLEGFNLTATLDLTDKTVFDASSSFKYDETTIYANGLKLKGNIDYTEIKNEIDKAEEGFPTDQKILSETNAYFQIGNIKADMLMDVDSMMIFMKNNVPAGEKMNDGQAVEMLNQHAKVYLRYADSKEIIAYGEFYLKPITETYWNGQEKIEETYFETSMRVIFSDTTALDESVYFDNGFSKMIEKINEMILTMNENYDMELEGIE
ncbi:MAG: hypothetical protein JEZ14_26320 [Marinilabiliaceae bacterium]|nr:hypothetical protein [Marinilabiliaceae bacterium]